MGHTHHHDDDGSYYMEQVCTIGISGMLGVIAIALYYNGRLGLMLAQSLHWTVLAGGIALVILAAIRVLALLVSMRQTAAAHAHSHAHDHDHGCGHDHDHAHDHHHDHDHDHGHCDHHHDHDHDHAHNHDHDHEHGHEHVHAAAGVVSEGAEPDHGHDHGHDHGYAPWRYVLLLLPIVLFFLNLPNEGFKDVGQVSAQGLEDAGGAQVADKGDIGELGFQELEGAVYDPDRRSLYEGKTVTLKGQFAPSGNDRIFSLVRFKIRCCAADAVPLNAFIVIDPESAEHINQAAMQGQWVAVKGKVQFRTRQVNGREESVAVILVRPDKEHPLGDLVRVLSKNEQPSAFL